MVTLVSDSAFIRTKEKEDVWLGLLCAGTSWKLIGRAKITFLCHFGAQVFGATIDTKSISTHTIYSPSTHCPVDLNISHQPIGNYFSLEDVLTYLSGCVNLTSEELGFISSSIKSESIDFSKLSAAIVVESLSCTVIESMEQITFVKSIFSPGFGFVNELKIIKGVTFALTSACQEDVYVESLESKSAFERILKMQSPRVLLCGPTNSGKSTFMRRLVNKFLSSGCNMVALLECDIGQSEFTPSGIVSLSLVKNFILGPPFTHPLHGNIHQISQCFYGASTPAANPSFYLDCLRHVFSAFGQFSNTGCPLIVNTMGWTSGLGLQILVDQIALTKPDIIVQLYQDGQRSNTRFNLPLLDQAFLRNSKLWDGDSLSDEVFCHEIITVPSRSRCGSAGFTSAQVNRDLMLLSYLLAGLKHAPTSLPGSGPNGRVGGPWSCGLGHPTAHLLDCLPYRVCVALPSASPGRPALHLLHPPLGFDPDALLRWPQIARCLNGTLVALCSVPQEIILPPKPDGLLLLSQSVPCEFIGCGIVRAVNEAEGILYITTGVSPEKLTSANAIIRGTVDLPKTLFTEQPLSPEAQLSYAMEQPGRVVPRPPYLSANSLQGAGRRGLNERRHHPRVNTLSSPASRQYSPHKF